MKKHLTCLLVLGVAASALAADLPQRKPGVWEIRSETPGKSYASPLIHYCIDEKVFAAFQTLGTQMRKDCAPPSIQKSMTGWVMDSVCKIKDRTLSSHAVVSGDLSSQYSVESITRFDPPINGKGESRNKVSARWIGPCPAGMKPGDVRTIDARIDALLERRKQGATSGR